MTEINISAKNYLERIEEVYIFVSSDKNGEGIIGRSIEMLGQNIFMPFVCADKERMESIKPLAKKIAKEYGKKIKLIKLSVREEIEEYN